MEYIGNDGAPPPAQSAPRSLFSSVFLHINKKGQA